MGQSLLDTFVGVGDGEQNPIATVGLSVDKDTAFRLGAAVTVGVLAGLILNSLLNKFIIK